MNVKRGYLIAALVVVLAVVLAACGSEGFDESAPSNDGRNNGSNNGEDAPGFDAGANNDAGDDDFVPEEEEEFEFSAPAVVGDEVYVANETLNSVAVIDSRNLAISSRLVGFRPTKVVGPDAERAAVDADAKVMVLNEGSRAVSVLSTDSDEVANVEVMARANAIAMDPTGRAAVVWYDPSEAEAGEPAGDLASVSVVRDGESFEVAAGFHVREVFFDGAGERALVLSDDGISRIDLTSLSGDGVAPATPLVPEAYEMLEPEDLEVRVSPDAKWAVTRSAGFAGAVLLDVDTGEHHFLELPEVPTDIELVESGELESGELESGELESGELEVMLVLRDQAKVVRASIPDGFRAAADEAVLPDVDGFEVIDVDSAASRLVLTRHEPGQATLWAPEDAEAAKVYLIFEAPESASSVEPSHRDVLTVDLRSFRTDSFRVPSLPEGLGPIPSAGRVYISQRHPQGRMTFVDVDTGARQTITGYQLNAGID